MAEKDRGFNIRRLFIRESGETPVKKQSQQESSGSSTAQDDYVTPSVSRSAGGITDQSLVDDFVQRLQNLINQNNQGGFDFLEFTESLFEEKQNPSPEVYKTVFRIAQKMDKSLTPSRLLDSARFYKDLVQRTADAEISKGDAKKKDLQADKDKEKNNLDSSLKDTRAKIQQLNRQIQDLQNQEVNLNNQLMDIDKKYENQFNDIGKKVTAIQNAKEQVISSIVDIEAGIKSNLS
jgi:hypothetical protein